MTVSLRNTPLLVAGAAGLSQSVTGSYNGTTTVLKDLLVAVVQWQATTSGTLGTAPSGWVLSALRKTDAAGTHVMTAVYTKVAAGSDAAPTFTATLVGTSARCDAQVTIYDFYDSSGNTPALADAGVAAGTSGTVAPVTLGQVPAGSYAIAAASAYGSVAVTWTTPSSGGTWVSRGTSSGGSAYYSYANYSLAAPASGALLTCSIAHSAGTTTYESAFVLVISPPTAVSKVNLLPLAGNSGGTAITVIIPNGTGIKAGDLIVVNVVGNGTHVANGVVVYDNVNGSGTPYPALGESQQSGSSSYYQDTKYFSTPVDIADGSWFAITPFASATGVAVVIDIFRGCTGAIDKALTGTNGSTAASTSIACPALGSNATAGALVVSLATGGGAYTIVQSTVTTGTTNSTTRNAGIGYQLSASGSSTYADTWTQGTSSSWAGQTVSFAAGPPAWSGAAAVTAAATSSADGTVTPGGATWNGDAAVSAAATSGADGTVTSGSGTWNGDAAQSSAATTGAAGTLGLAGAASQSSGATSTAAGTRTTSGGASQSTGAATTGAAGTVTHSGAAAVTAAATSSSAASPTTGSGATVTAAASTSADGSTGTAPVTGQATVTAAASSTASGTASHDGAASVTAAATASGTGGLALPGAAAPVLAPASTSSTAQLVAQAQAAAQATLITAAAGQVTRAVIYGQAAIAATFMPGATTAAGGAAADPAGQTAPGAMPGSDSAAHSSITAGATPTAGEA